MMFSCGSLSSIIRQAICVALFFLSECMTGCATQGLWSDKNIWEIKSEDSVDSKTINVNSEGVYYSSDLAGLCVPYQFISDSSNESGGIIIKLGKSQYVNNIISILSNQDDLPVQNIIAEYRDFTPLKPFSDSKNQHEQIFTMVMQVPISDTGFSVIEDQGDYRYIKAPPRINQPFSRIAEIKVQGIKRPEIDNYLFARYYFWPTDHIDPAFHIKTILIDQKISSFIKDMQPPLYVEPVAWIDPNGNIEYTDTRIASSDGANGLLIRVGPFGPHYRYYRIQSKFYSTLKQWGAFQGGYFGIVSYDPNTKLAGVGLRVVNKANSFRIIDKQEITNCRADGWKLLFNANKYPYSFSLAESKEKHPYKYPLVARTLLTPVAITYDIVTAPLLFVYVSVIMSLMQ